MAGTEVKPWLVRGGVKSCVAWPSPRPAPRGLFTTHQTTTHPCLFPGNPIHLTSGPLLGPLLTWTACLRVGFCWVCRVQGDLPERTAPRKTLLLRPAGGNPGPPFWRFRENLLAK